ncbi:MAG: hypothetical protein MJK10_17550 [Pseudomonadales bacterium]|nr:hypothetical protein [Pseudomonadales bacterium]NRA17939.1 hypothetical protein [Oceanospirillaceae bacterium]
MNKGSNKFFLAAGIFLMLFSVNVMVGKISMSMFNQQLPLSIGEVPEFLLLFITCILFVGGILGRESEAKDASK